MKKKIFFLLILISTNCKNVSKKQSDNSNKSAYLKIKNEVVIKLNESITPFTINTVDNIYEKNVQLILVNNRENNFITIPTDSILKVVVLNNYKYGDVFIFKKGDTVSVSQKTIFIDGKEKVAYPYFTSLSENEFELNFNFLVSKKTPTFDTFDNYLSHNAFLNRNNVNPKITLKYSFDDVLQNTKKILDSLFLINKISEKFYQNKKVEIEIHKATRDMYHNINKSKDSLNIPFSISNINLYKNETYLIFLDSYINLTLQKNNRKNTYKDRINFLFENDTILKKELRNALLFKYLKIMNNSNYDFFLKRYEDFKLLNVEKEYIEYFEGLNVFMSLDDNKTQFSEQTGKLKKIENDSLFDFNKIIEKEKGKIILVDFWASWCAPCRKQMPNIKSLLSKFKPKDFTVISISIDKNFDSWKKSSIIEELNKQNHNYFLINSEESSLIKKNGVSTIPRYFLYDKNGFLVNDNAPYPDNPKLSQLIESYLSN